MKTNKSYNKAKKKSDLLLSEIDSLLGKRVGNLIVLLAITTYKKPYQNLLFPPYQGKILELINHAYKAEVLCNVLSH